VVAHRRLEILLILGSSRRWTCNAEDYLNQLRPGRGNVVLFAIEKNRKLAPEVAALLISKNDGALLADRCE